jgi:predicted esterase
MTDAPPAPGQFVRQTAPEYASTNVYHGLYLPTDWHAGKLYPVIVEYAGNRWPPVCTGRVEDCKLGFHQSGGQGFLWIVLPYVSEDNKENQLTWWGDLDATVAYCKTNVPRICRQYGGDASAVFLTGFSRGAIACGYVGLRDDEIAKLWLGFLPHSHHDGGSFTPNGARERLARINGRASFLSWGQNDGGKTNSLLGKALLEEFGFPVTAVEIPGLDHSDEWIVQDSPQRRELRRWLAEIIRTRPGQRA